MCIQDIDLCLSSVEFSLLPLIFSVMGPIVNISSFVGHVVSVCSAITSATIDKWTWMCSDKTLFANTGIGPDLVRQISVLEEEVATILRTLCSIYIESLKICISFDPAISF